MTLDKIYPEFAELMNEYRDGIYIFKLQDNEIWNKIDLDSAKIYAYWLKNKANYKWTDRIEIGEIFSNDSLKINEYYKMLKAGENFDSLAAKYTERDGFKEKAGRYSLEDVLTSDLHVHAFTMNVGEYTEPLSAPGGGFSIIKVFSKDPARIKTFEEARAEASGAYQEEESRRLENEYLDYLNKMYHPKYFYEELTKAYKIEE
jgi:peptidyl-prolyl cis-trans isomerase SurA